MLKQLQNIDTAFKHIKLFSFIVIVASATIACYSAYLSYSYATSKDQKIYLLSNGKVLEAFSADRKDNIPVEARDHVKMFHHYFFTLDPDDKVIKENLNKALYLADISAKREYDNLKEKRFYANIISGNISQEIDIDSVQLNLDNYPYKFICYAKQRLIRTTAIVHRKLVTSGYLRNVNRSDYNPHGFLIENWATLENPDVKVETR